MKITSVQVIPVSIPMQLPVVWAGGVIDRFNHVLVRIMTDEGIEGIAEGVPRQTIYGETQASVTAMINAYMGPAIIGMDPMDLEKIHEKLNFYPNNLVPKAAIDVALHDVIGKKLGVPVYKLLGGYRDKARMSWTLAMETMEVMMEEAKAMIAKGYKAFKVKSVADPEVIIEKIRKLREILPEDTILYIDGNMTFDYFGAKKIISALGEKLNYFEEPIHVNNVADRVRLAQSVDTPILGDESTFTLWAVARQLELGALGIVMCKVPRTGFTYARKIAALCEVYHKPMLVGTQAETALGVMAIAHLTCGLKSMTYPCEVEYYRAGPGRTLILEEPKIEAGYLYAPQRPGLGVTLDEDKLREFAMQ
jgi:muconate cycloisomerase